mgnify:CR=1 FL=1
MISSAARPSRRGPKPAGPSRNGERPNSPPQKPGVTYGASDELGFDAAENKVHVRDLQATIKPILA